MKLMTASRLFHIIKFAPFYLWSVIPLRVMYVFSDIAFFVLYNIVMYRRKVVYRNLRTSFPEKEISEIKIIEKGFYRHFCDQMIESVKLLTISKNSMKKRFRVKNPGLILDYINQNKSIIVYMGHLGNWEWLASLPLYYPYQVLAFYQPLSSGYFDRMFKLLRERFGLIAVESDRGYRTLIDYSNKHIRTITLILGDQSPPGDSTKHWVRFLNHETAFLVGADRIAKRTRQVVVFPSITQKARGRYELEFLVIEENTDETRESLVIEKYAKTLESAITQSPHLYLWTHRRWKLKKPGAITLS